MSDRYDPIAHLPKQAFRGSHTYDERYIQCLCNLRRCIVHLATAPRSRFELQATSNRCAQHVTQECERTSLPLRGTDLSTLEQQRTKLS